VSFPNTGVFTMHRIWRIVFLPSLLLVLSLALASPGRADGPKVVPVPSPEPDKWAKLEGASAGKLFVLSAEPASRWRLETPGAELRVFDNGKSGVFLAPIPATYRLTVTAPSGDVSQIEIVVAGSVPPGPGPGPKPPEPPADPLKARLKASFEGDAAPLADRKKQAAALAELYRTIGEKTCRKADITTAGQFLDVARDSAKGLVGEKALVGLRTAVSDELAVIIPIDAPLTDEQRDSLARLFGRLAEVLDGF
jgi:hypothetical protein